MIFAPLTMLCLLCAPALAQSSPSASQYEPGTCPPDSCSTQQSLADGADDLSDNALQGTGPERPRDAPGL